MYVLPKIFAMVYAWVCCVPYAYFIPYAYGTYCTSICVRYNHTRMVWLFVPYEYIATSYTITVHQCVTIANTVLLFVLDPELYPRCSFLGRAFYMH